MQHHRKLRLRYHEVDCTILVADITLFEVEVYQLRSREAITDDLEAKFDRKLWEGGKGGLGFGG
jgi:hypothetical protein